jgi:hypothetical protein
MLFLPEEQPEAGLQHGCAELILHVSLYRAIPVAVIAPRLFRRPQYWRARFEETLALPGQLADWLTDQLGLETSAEPSAQSGIMLQAEQTIEELVDTTGIRKLPAPYPQNQLSGWAVAAAKGKTRHDLAAGIMLDLSERVLHLDGSIEEMSGLG